MANKSPMAGAPPRSSWQDASRAFLDTYKVLRKRWAWVLTLTGLAVAVAGFYTAGQQRIYRSRCTIQIDPTPPRPLGKDVQAIVDLGSASYWANAEYYKTQFQILQSRSVAEEVVRRLGLHRDPAFVQGLSPGEKPVEGPGAPEFTVEQTAGLVHARLSVEPVRDTRLVNLSYRDANPERARQIMATIVNVYMDRNVDVAMASSNTAADWLRAQLENLKQELDGSELELHEYKKGNRILSVSLDDQSNMLRQEMQQLSAALTAVRVRRTQVAAQAEELRKLDEEGVSIPSADLLRDETLQRLRYTLSQAEAERDSLLGEGKGERHPQVASAIARVETTREALKVEIKNVREAAQREQAIVDHEIASLSQLFEQAQQRAQDLGRLEIDYRRLERDKTNTEKLYSLVLERSKESDLTRVMRFNNIQVIDAPVVPVFPVSPRVPLNMAIGLVGGVLLGLIGALGREMFDQSVKSPRDIEELGVTFLGLLPRLGQTESPAYGRNSRKVPRRRPDGPSRVELIVHEEPTSVLSEAARAVRTNLSFMSPDKPFRTLLVTSAGPTEGKTTVACWVATAMAQAGQRVLLVDCDLRRPRLHRVFNLTNERGVTSALMDRSSLSSAVHETEVPGLSVLLSGPSSPSPAESLQSQSFTSLLAELAATFDRVVIDSPPVGPVTDAVILSTHVDASVLVVRAQASARDAVRHALRSLQDVRANLTGAVLNAADQGGGGYSYYSGYYARD